MIELFSDEDLEKALGKPQEYGTDGANPFDFYWLEITSLSSVEFPEDTADEHEEAEWANLDLGWPDQATLFYGDLHPNRDSNS